MKVVILNDTRPDHHHGCSRVMRLLEDGLLRHGMTITGRSPVRHDWLADKALRRAMTDADLIVINGEGTLHHGKPAAARLLGVTDVAGTTPVALVNALYQDNPVDWVPWLDKLAYISTRDSRSAEEIASRIGRRPVVVPDLTLSRSIAQGPVTAPIVYGDSVTAAVSAALAQRARAQLAPLVPSLSQLKRPKGRTRLTRLLRRWWVDRYQRHMMANNPTLTLCATEDAYAARIASAGLHVTGRFHGVCFSMAAGRPFVAVASNSWKIEALIADAGLAPWRVTTADQLADRLAGPAADLGFSVAEQAALTDFLDRASKGAEAMFASLAELARNGR